MSTPMSACPFCGAAPTVEPRKGKFAAAVRCENEACGVNPESMSLDIAYAKARWNHRPRPTQSKSQVSE